MIIVQRRRKEKGYSVPSGAAVYWQGVAAALPDGWALDTSAYDKLIKGAGMGGASNVSAGADTHKHSLSIESVSAHTHTVSYAISSPASGGMSAYGSVNKVAASNHGHDKGNATSGSGGAHGHSIGDTDPFSNLPPYERLYLIKATEDAIVPAGGIIMWNAVLAGKPEGFTVCDGTNGTPDMRDKFVYVAAADADVGDSGGASSHGHGIPNTASGGVHNHSYPGGTTGGPTTKSNAYYYGIGDVEDVTSENHTHSINAGTADNCAAHSHVVSANTSTEAILPKYLKLYYLMRVEG